MSLFSSEPPEDPRGQTLQLCRTPAQRPIRLICTSTEMTGCRTHFWHGRTVPCFYPLCSPCGEGMPWRWHGWVGAYAPRTHQHLLFEVTAQASNAFKQYRKANGTLRGVAIEASRPSKQANGRLLLRLTACDVSGINLPDAPNVMAVLSILWNIKLEDLERGYLENGHPVLKVKQPEDYSAPGTNPQGLNDAHSA